MTSGAMRLLKINAGKAEAMPAINHDSADLLLVGSPIELVDVPHQASTGSEKPINHMGIASRMKSAIPASSVVLWINRAVRNTPTETVIPNNIQSCLLGGMSRIESSLTRNLWNEVLVGVIRDPPSGSA